MGILIKSNLSMILKNKLHMIFFVLVYGFGYMVPYGLNWFYTDNNWKISTVQEELYIFALLPASVFMVLNSSYFQYDKQLFCTFTKSAWKAVCSLYISFFLFHTVMFLAGNTFFSGLSFLMEGYFNVKLTVIHDTVMILQYAAGLFLIFAFAYLFRNTLFAYLAYGIVIMVSISAGKNVFTIFPVTAYIVNTLDYYQSMNWQLWGSRVIQIFVFFCFFLIVYMRYLKKMRQM